MKKFLLLFFFSTLSAESVLIYNDSIYTLTAQIISGGGDNLGGVTVLPKHQMRWTSSYQGLGVYSQTPYTIVFSCVEGEEYGITTNVPQGATVNAQSAQGRKYCPPKNKRQPQTQEYKYDTNPQQRNELPD